MLLELNQIIVPPSQQLLFKNVSWQMYENILAELGERRGRRINYYQGMLKIVTTLPEHEDDKLTQPDRKRVGDEVSFVISHL